MLGLLLLPLGLPTAAAAQIVVRADMPVISPSADMEIYFDGLVPAALRQSGIPGAAISIVKDGEIVFAKGYGIADLATKQPVSASATLFRPGSVSKLVTWTAVMQLVEQGKLGLDEDINRYLDFKIPKSFERPISLRHLLTHTAGFEDVSRDFGAVRPRPGDLGRHIRTHVPTRIFAPGKRIAYSNFGAALAGYIVERASGESFERYTKRHIFDPLGMTRTSFEQPLPALLDRMMAKGYPASSAPLAEPFEVISVAPAGALSSTATDMARFMVAHLQGGSLGNVRILRAETIALMHRRHHQAAPGRNGLTLGFWEANRNGRRIIGHSGDIASFHANLHLAPADGYGIFVALNGTGEKGRKLGSDVVRTLIAEAFFDRYLPGKIADEPTLAGFDAQRFAGYYSSTRRNESAMRVRLLFQADDRVKAFPDGTITVSSRATPSGALKRWRPVAPLVFREIDGQAHLSFVEGRDGQIVYWISDDYPPAMVFERLGGLRGTGWLQSLVFVAVGICAVVSVTAAFRRLRGRTAAKALCKLWAASRIGYGVQALVMLSWMVFIVTGIVASDNVFPLTLLRSASFIAIAAAVPTVSYAVRTLVDRSAPLLRRLAEPTTALASLFVARFVIDHQLISFSTSF